LEIADKRNFGKGELLEKYMVKILLLWFKPQSIKIRKESYIRLTQENSIEFQV